MNYRSSVYMISAISLMLFSAQECKSMEKLNTSMPKSPTVRKIEHYVHLMNLYREKDHNKPKEQNKHARKKTVQPVVKKSNTNMSQSKTNEKIAGYVHLMNLYGEKDKTEQEKLLGQARKKALTLVDELPEEQARKKLLNELKAPRTQRGALRHITAASMNSSVK